MAEWNFIIYICTTALHSFLSSEHCRGDSTIIPLVPKATFTPSIQPIMIIIVNFWQADLRPKRSSRFAKKGNIQYCYMKCRTHALVLWEHSWVMGEQQERNKTKIQTKKVRREACAWKETKRARKNKSRQRITTKSKYNNNNIPWLSPSTKDW